MGFASLLLKPKDPALIWSNDVGVLQSIVMFLSPVPFSLLGKAQKDTCKSSFTKHSNTEDTATGRHWRYEQNPSLPQRYAGEKLLTSE